MQTHSDTANKLRIYGVELEGLGVVSSTCGASIRPILSLLDNSRLSPSLSTAAPESPLGRPWLLVVPNTVPVADRWVWMANKKSTCVPTLQECTAGSAISVLRAVVSTTTFEIPSLRVGSRLSSLADIEHFKSRALG
ncbi:unnamed protein product [Calypogeia fissa]